MSVAVKLQRIAPVSCCGNAAVSKLKLPKLLRPMLDFQEPKAKRSAPLGCEHHLFRRRRNIRCTAAEALYKSQDVQTKMQQSVLISGAGLAGVPLTPVQTTCTSTVQVYPHLYCGLPHYTCLCTQASFSSTLMCSSGIICSYSHWYCAGLCLAAALERVGIPYYVLEQRNELSLEGAAIALWRNALTALDAIGASTFVHLFQHLPSFIRFRQETVSFLAGQLSLLEL
jgi:hypothetical protein